jgi:hypothetical protein
LTQENNPRKGNEMGTKEQSRTAENGIVVYQRSHKRGLTLPQLNAVDLLAGGMTDGETAMNTGHDGGRRARRETSSWGVL